MNLYAYAAGNPVHFADPMGLLVWDVQPPWYATVPDADALVMICGGRRCRGITNYWIDFFCDCACDPASGAYKAAAGITARWLITTSSTPVWDATPQQALVEEQKHVAADLEWLRYMRDMGLALEAKKFPTKAACDLECRLWKALGYAGRWLGARGVDWTHPSSW
jgi:hypothetical protein